MTAGQKRELKKFIDTAKIETHKNPGRVTSLTWEKLIEIRALLYEGQFQKYVAGSMGIPQSTWDTWKHKGNKLNKAIQDKELLMKNTSDVEQRYMYLAYVIGKGQKKAIIRAQRGIAEAGKKDWRALKWFLEVVDRDTYGEKIDANITGDVNMASMMDVFLKHEAEEEQNE